MEEGEVTKENQLKEKQIHWEIYKNNINEEETWRLKSINLWIQVGDHNTTFLHNTTKMRNIKNHIETIKGEREVETKGHE